MSNEVAVDRLPELSYLPAAGKHVTSHGMSAWIDAVAERIRAATGPGPITCVISSYRLGHSDNSHSNIAVDWDLSDGATAGTGYPMTIAIDGTSSFRKSPSLSDPLMPDVAEAMHCIAQIADRLSATVKLAA